MWCFGVWRSARRVLGVLGRGEYENAAMGGEFEEGTSELLCSRLASPQPKQPHGVNGQGA